MIPIKTNFVAQKYLKFRMGAAVTFNEAFFSGDFDFEKTALEIFRFQYTHNPVYKNYVDAIGTNLSGIDKIEKIPFLPIRFFKTHKVIAAPFQEEVVFESSGTTGTINSRHYIKSKSLYEKSLFACFNQFYGAAADWCILGLLPSYLERNNSSLVYMVQKLIEKSNHKSSGFYLYEFDKLKIVLKDLEQQKQKTLLIGVTFALLDLAAQHHLKLDHTIIMETGGMKGRREEMIRAEVHDMLKSAFGLKQIHSEYGMTELLSQAYSKGDGIFKPPVWMRILLRDEEDPLTIKKTGSESRLRGIINIIDLANIYSCSFIATDDLGILHQNGTFEITGRMDNSDLRGCSLLAL
ncbi:MAG: acyl transferase [Niabella sp.]